MNLPIEVAIFAWEGNMNDTVYVMPIDQAEDFEARYSTGHDSWVRMDTASPAHPHPILIGMHNV